MNVSSPPTLAADRLLDVADLEASYGRAPILNGVSLHVRPNEVVGIIGPNGAGKSTVLKSVMGFLRPLAGQIRFAGQEIGGLRTDRVVQRGIGYVPQGRIVFPDMSVAENLEMGAFLVRDRQQKQRNLERVFSLFPILAERRTQRAGTMSGGEQQMVAMGRALMTNPQLLLLDEPSLGLSPLYVDLVFSKIQELGKAGMSMLMVEQNAARALEIVDRAYVLELGHNRLEGPGKELLADGAVRRLYLGG
ncbi:MAG: ABC transporter ATP-binding protein [Chloroflexi bacterium]|nr:ABC transporter ATP-binding protein [Chloroflexota bacterium]